jgi:hypothetical protein
MRWYNQRDGLVGSGHLWQACSAFIGIFWGLLPGSTALAYLFLALTSQRGLSSQYFQASPTSFLMALAGMFVVSVLTLFFKKVQGIGIVALITLLFSLFITFSLMKLL